MRLIILILTVSVLFSCEEEITLNEFEFTPQLVVNAVVSTDSIWNIHISSSRSILDTGSSIENVENAVVKIRNLGTNQTFYLDHKSGGFYQRHLFPHEGQRYELSVDHAGYEDVAGQTHIPSVINVSMEEHASESEDGTIEHILEIEIEDNPDEDNYYVWELQEKIHTLPSEQGQPDVPDANYTFTDVVENKENTKSLNDPSFLSDKDFNENRYNATIDISQLYRSSNTTGDDPGVTPEQKRFELRVMAVSEELYKYLRSVDLYAKLQIKNTSQAQPADIFTNIEDGLGIFGGYNLKIFEF